MHEKFSHVFGKFMKFGGIENAPRQFTGKIGQEELEQYDSAQIASMMATYHVRSDRDDATQWAVDFEAVAKGFLASQVPAVYECTDEQIDTVVRVLTNFYNYLLLHEVCTEYNDQILAARKVVELAAVQLPKVRSAGIELPGIFNIACSTLFGGHYAGMYTGDQTWAQELTGPAIDDSLSVGLRKETARIVFNTAIAAYGTDDQYAQLERAGITSLKSIDELILGLEVVAVAPADAETAKIYAAANEDLKAKVRVPPLGRLTVTTWPVPGVLKPDLPPHLMNDPKHNPLLVKKRPRRSFTLLVEDYVLQHCFPGMKMEAQLRKLDLGHEGLWWLDRVEAVHCAFYQWLPNELWMKGWKEVEVLNGRRAAEVAQEAERGNERALEEMEKERKKAEEKEADA